VSECDQVITNNLDTWCEEVEEVRTTNRVLRKILGSKGDKVTGEW
jgi:hypothetical protein